MTGATAATSAANPRRQPRRRKSSDDDDNNHLFYSHSSSSSRSSSFRSTATSAASSAASPPPAGAAVGVPFSWEDLPGVAKQTHPLDTSTAHPAATDLPPPPAGGRRRHDGAGHRDPFQAALLECSRGSDGGGGWSTGRKVGRSVSERFGVRSFDRLSCRRSCGISDGAIVALPRSRRLAYGMVNKDSGDR